MSKPQQIVDEASDIHTFRGEFARGELGFGARPTKRIRRKLTSSELAGNTGMVIFDNVSLASGKIDGGPFWKSYLQKGRGKLYNRISLDQVSIPQLILFLNKAPYADIAKNLCRVLLKEVRKGVPTLKDGWIEFPGWSHEPDRYLPFVSQNRLKLPSVSFFQKAFTERLEEIGEFISPIDFFDGLDAIMLLAFSRKEFQHLQKEMIHLESLADSGKYNHKSDPRVATKLTATEIPLVTIVSCLLSILVLSTMYETDHSLPEGDSYPESAKTAKNSIIKWCT